MFTATTITAISDNNGTHTSNSHTNDRINGHIDGEYRNQAAFKDSLAKKLYVRRSTKAFGSAAISLVSLSRGSLFAPMHGITPAPKAYSSVQISQDEHIELNSELVFCNHSCAPTLEFDVGRLEVRVARDRDLKEGDVLTFWYPSTEWDMAQPFECTCGSEGCKGLISGAGQMEEKLVREYWLNGHIEELLKKSNEKGKNGVTNETSDEVH